MDDGALVGDIEHRVDPSDAQAETDEAAEFDNLGRAEVSIDAVEELAAHLGVRKTKAFSELNRQALTVGQCVEVAITLDRGVFGLGDFWLRSRRSSSVQSNRTGIDLGDPHPSQFLLAC